MLNKINIKVIMKRATPIRTKQAAKEIGESISTWRKLRGLTMQQLAEKANISRQTLSNIEKGDPSTSFESILNIAIMLGIIDGLTKAFDPYETDYGRLRSTEELPQRVRRSK